jgi:hypothetical protein
VLNEVEHMWKRVRREELGTLVSRREAMSGIQTMSEESFLNHIRSKIGLPPRSLGWFKPSPFAVPEPSWMAQAKDSDEPMKEVIKGQKSLWKHGVVVWGHVVRANNRLYEPGTDDCPATLIFSATAPDNEAVNELPVLAEKLHHLRASVIPEPGWTQRETDWWEDLRNDMSYHRGFKLPEEWQQHSKDYKGSSFLIHRAHLPEGRITSRLLPILVDPVACIAQTIPHSEWPEGMAAWLADTYGFSSPQRDPDTEFGDSSQFLAKNPADRNEREKAYSGVFGPIESVYHELIPLPHHIDVYHFTWDAPRDEQAYVTGGMSDAIQPGGGDYGRIELVLYTKHEHERFQKMLRSFARYPWETGSPIHPFDTIPLGTFGNEILGSDRFNTLMFLPGVAKPESAIHQAPCLVDSNTRLLTIVPLTNAELRFKLSHDTQAFLDLMQESKFDLAFTPDRPSLI